MSVPNISSRDYIHWQGYPPSEPTSTLVLTSKESYFVDLRIFGPLVPDEPPLPNVGGPMQRLEWGFAGVSDSWDSNDDSTRTQDSEASQGMTEEQSKPKNARWWHWVDSRVPLTPLQFCDSVTYEQNVGCEWVRGPQSRVAGNREDEDPFVDPASPTFSNASTVVSGPSGGVLFFAPLKNFVPVMDAGMLHPVPEDPELTRETGTMVNPATAVPTPYEEMWRDVGITCTDIESAEGVEIKYSIVLTLEMPEIHARGMVIRVGQWCQGILAIGEQVTVERWEFMWKEGKEMDGNWTRTVRLGDGFLPTGMVFRANGVKLGDVCRSGDMTWVVRERFEWSE